MLKNELLSCYVSLNLIINKHLDALISQLCGIVSFSFELVFRNDMLLIKSHKVVKFDSNYKI